MGLAAFIRPHCIEDPRLLAVYLVGHLWIAWSYLCIPRTLGRMRRQAGGRLTEGGEVRGVERFVRACAGTHLFAVATLFLPSLDWVAMGQLLYAAAVSWATAGLLRREASAIVAEILAARQLEARLADAHPAPS